jgi:hypothetical protein
MLSPCTWTGTDSAVAQVDPCFPAVAAGLAVLLMPAVGAELADPQRPAEEAGKLDFQRSGVTPGPIWMAHEWPMSAGARV